MRKKDPQILRNEGGRSALLIHNKRGRGEFFFFYYKKLDNFDATLGVRSEMKYLLRNPIFHLMRLSTYFIGSVVYHLSLISSVKISIPVSLMRHSYIHWYTGQTGFLLLDSPIRLTTYCIVS